MFILEGKLTFINIEQSYLKKLHDACSEVYYKPSGYENKPYIGILINKNDRKYIRFFGKRHKTSINLCCKVNLPKFCVFSNRNAYGPLKVSQTGVVGPALFPGARHRNHILQEGIIR